MSNTRTGEGRGGEGRLTESQLRGLRERMLKLQSILQPFLERRTADFAPARPLLQAIVGDYKKELTKAERRVALESLIPNSDTKLARWEKLLRQLNETVNPETGKIQDNHFGRICDLWRFEMYSLLGRTVSDPALEFPFLKREDYVLVGDLLRRGLEKKRDMADVESGKGPEVMSPEQKVKQDVRRVIEVFFHDAPKVENIAAADKALRARITEVLGIQVIELTDLKTESREAVARQVTIGGKQHKVWAYFDVRIAVGKPVCLLWHLVEEGKQVERGNDNTVASAVRKILLRDYFDQKGDISKAEGDKDQKTGRRTMDYFRRQFGLVDRPVLLKALEGIKRGLDTKQAESIDKLINFLKTN